MTRDSVHLVKISGDAGLRAAQQVLDLLQQALAAHQTIAVDTGAISAADVTTVQLLLAARKLAIAEGKSLSLAAAPAGALHDILVQTGFLDDEGRPLTPEGEFWTPLTSPARDRAA